MNGRRPGVLAAWLLRGGRDPRNPPDGVIVKDATQYGLGQIQPFNLSPSKLQLLFRG